MLSPWRGHIVWPALQPGQSRTAGPGAASPQFIAQRCLCTGGKRLTLGCNVHVCMKKLRKTFGILVAKSSWECWKLGAAGSNKFSSVFGGRTYRGRCPLLHAFRCSNLPYLRMFVPLLFASRHSFASPKPGRRCRLTGTGG